MKYHVLFGETIIASFQHHLHREIFLSVIFERFPYVEGLVKTSETIN